MGYYSDDGFKLMTKRKNKSVQGKPVALILLALLSAGLLIMALLMRADVVLLNPKGIIAEEQARLMIFTVGVLLSIAIPTLTLLYFFAWKYRETNQNAKHDPNKKLGGFSSFGLWLIPASVVLLLTAVVWPATHQLDPHKAIASNKKPLTIQVIAMQWKWLFIYPEQNIATVNFVQIPVNTPVQFELTADEAPMNSFWIPHLGGQLYAMTGHSNRLNLMADTPGDFAGQAAEINGEGFAGMKFIAQAVPGNSFEDWVQGMKAPSKKLDSAEYKKLLAPSENNPPAFYSSVEPNLYDKVLLKYGDSHSHQEGTE
jgi:cytochrome o ubiquinol oxidase subunit II